MKKKPFFQQTHPNDNGLTCLKMIAAYRGKDYSVDFLKEKSSDIQSPMSIEDIGIVAERVGFRSRSMELIYIQLAEEIHFPVIIPWKREYFVVLYDVKVSFWSFLPWVSKEEYLIIADPSSKLMKVDKKTFIENWKGEGRDKRKGKVLTIQSAI